MHPLGVMASLLLSNPPQQCQPGALVQVLVQVMHCCFVVAQTHRPFSLRLLKLLDLSNSDEPTDTLSRNERDL